MEYECTFRTEDYTGARYDLEPMCSDLPFNQYYPYQWTEPGTGGKTYVWNVCGVAPTTCTPTYKVPYNGGSAMQIFNDQPDPNATCYDVYGNQAPCTGSCEVLSVGPPSITLYNPRNDFGGINISHPGVGTLREYLLWPVPVRAL